MTPTRKITCTLVAPFRLAPHHYIQITHDENRTYKIDGFSWNVRAGEYEVELPEVLTDLPIRVLYLLAEDYRHLLAEDGRPKLCEPYR